MKVVQLAGTLAAGGIEALVKDYAIGLNEYEDIECTVLLFGRGDKITANEKTLQEHQIEVRCLEEFISPSKNELVKGAKRIMALRKCLREMSPDVVHLQVMPFYILPAFSQLDVRQKLFHTVHSEPCRLFEGTFRRVIRRYTTSQLMKHRGMQLIALHEEMRLELNEMFHVDNTVVVNNGIDMERFNPALYAENRTSFRGQIGLEENDFVVGHVGRFSEEKNHKFLIDVFTQLYEKQHNAKLLLVGYGSLEDAILDQIERNGVSDRVVMLKNRSDIPELMSLMDVFVFPSIFEGLPVTMVEAQAMGLTCVVSDRISPATHLTERYYSLGLEEGVDRWCDAILGERTPSTPNGQLKDFDMREVVRGLERIYRGEQ